MSSYISFTLILVFAVLGLQDYTLHVVIINYFRTRGETIISVNLIKMPCHMFSQIRSNVFDHKSTWVLYAACIDHMLPFYYSTEIYIIRNLLGIKQNR